MGSSSGIPGEFDSNLRITTGIPFRKSHLRHPSQIPSKWVHPAHNFFLEPRLRPFHNHLVTLHREGESAVIARKKPIVRAWRWIVSQIVQEVPEDIMVCEYDCRKSQCTITEAEGCNLRLQKGAGRLSPLIEITWNPSRLDRYSLALNPRRAPTVPHPRISA